MLSSFLHGKIRLADVEIETLLRELSESTLARLGVYRI